MIDVTTITDTKELLEMKNDLNFFINKKIVVELYAEEGKKPFEVELDRQQARQLLSNVTQQLAKLNRAKPLTSGQVSRD